MSYRIQQGVREFIHPDKMPTAQSFHRERLVTKQFVALANIISKYCTLNTSYGKQSS